MFTARNAQPIRRTEPIAPLIGAVREQITTALGIGLACYLRLILRTARIDIRFGDQVAAHLDSGRGGVILHWHGRLALAVLFGMVIASGRHRKKWPWAMRPVGLVKPRAEGLIFKKCLERLSIPTADSDPKGARRLRAMLAEGHAIVTPADGPRGPVYRVNSALARLIQSGASALPVGCTATRAIRFRTWDRFLLPLPFARLIYVWGDPVAMRKEAGPLPPEPACKTLEQSLLALTEEAESLRGAAPAGWTVT